MDFDTCKIILLFVTSSILLIHLAVSHASLQHLKDINVIDNVKWNISIGCKERFHAVLNRPRKLVHRIGKFDWNTTDTASYLYLEKSWQAKKPLNFYFVFDAILCNQFKIPRLSNVDITEKQ